MQNEMRKKITHNMWMGTRTSSIVDISINVFYSISLRSPSFSPTFNKNAYYSVHFDADVAVRLKLPALHLALSLTLSSSVSLTLSLSISLYLSSPALCLFLQFIFGATL